MDGEGEKGTQTANVLLASLRVLSAFLETQSPVMASFEVEREELASAQEARSKAERVLKDAVARESAAKAKLKAAMAAAPPPVPPKRASSNNCQAVDEETEPDRPRKVSRGLQCFALEEQVVAKFLASSKGGQSTGWYKGKVVARHDRDETFVYDIKYDDGDQESSVLPRYVRSCVPPAARQASPHEATAQAPAPAPAARAPAPAPRTSEDTFAPAPTSPAKAPAPAPAPPPAQPPAPPPAPAPKAPTMAPTASPAKASAASAASSAPPMAEACTADANVFLYSEPWHATADQCMQRGCRLQHVQLQDFLPHAQSGDRNKLRTAVRAGKMRGTANVPKLGESGIGSQRTHWWWHAGDPALGLARQLLRK